LYSGTTRARAAQAEVAPSPPSPSSTLDEGLDATGRQPSATTRPDPLERRAHDPQDVGGVSEIAGGNAVATRATRATATDAATTPSADACATAAHAVATYPAAGPRVLGPTTTTASAWASADTHVRREMSGKRC